MTSTLNRQDQVPHLACLCPPSQITNFLDQVYYYDKMWNHRNLHTTHLLAH